MKRLSRIAASAALLPVLGLGAAAAQERQAGASEPPVLEHPVKVAGCVYQVSDQPTLFALRQTERFVGSASQTEAVASAGRAAASPAGTAGTADAGAAGAWYRLGASSQEHLSRHVGHRVEIAGELMPGRDGQGADVVIHRLEPDRVSVTAVDLQPAPQLSIHSISPSSGDCEAPAPAAEATNE